LQAQDLTPLQGGCATSVLSRASNCREDSSLSALTESRNF
jgi:hypothetical protein